MQNRAHMRICVHAHTRSQTCCIHSCRCIVSWPHPSSSPPSSTRPAPTASGSSRHSSRDAPARLAPRSTRRVLPGTEEPCIYKHINTHTHAYTEKRGRLACTNMFLSAVQNVAYVRQRSADAEYKSGGLQVPNAESSCRGHLERWAIDPFVDARCLPGQEYEMTSCLPSWMSG